MLYGYMCVDDVHPCLLVVCITLLQCEPLVNDVCGFTAFCLEPNNHLYF